MKTDFMHKFFELTLVSIISILFIAPVNASNIFSDLPEDHVYIEALDNFIDSGNLKGYPDGTLKPDNTINRGEFAILLNQLVLEKEEMLINGIDCFPDLKDWHAEEVCMLKLDEYVEGYPDGLFHPEKNIKFAEAAKILGQIYGDDIQEDDDAKWYGPYMAELLDRNAIPITINTVGKELTRAEVIEILYRLENKIVDKPSMSHYYHFQGYTNLPHDGMIDDLFYVTREIDNFLFMSYYNEIEYNGSIYNVRRECTKAVNCYMSKGSDHYDWQFVHTYSRMIHEDIVDPNSYYSIKDNQVYRLDQLISGADSDSFVSFSYRLAKDKKSLFANGERVKLEATLDFDSLEYINYNYIKDRNDVYYIDYDPIFAPNLIPKDEFKIIPLKADPNSFEVNRASFAKDNNHVYYYGDNIFEGADPNSFELLDYSYQKDANHVYYNYEILSGFDVPSFNILGDRYAIDANGVYYDYQGIFDSSDIIIGADPNTFEVTKWSLAKDQNNVYSNGMVIEEADSNTLAMLDYNFFRDANHVYQLNSTHKGYSLLEDIDPDTFRFFPRDGQPSFLISDKNGFYYMLKGIKAFPNIDADTFEVINYIYGRDKEHVYYIHYKRENTGPVLIPEADLNTFKVIHRWHAEDKNNKYTNGIIVDDFGDFDINSI